MTDDLCIVNKSGNRTFIALVYLISLLCLHGINAKCASNLDVIGISCQSVVSSTYSVSLAVDMISGQRLGFNHLPDHCHDVGHLGS